MNDLERIKQLPCWNGPVEIEPLSGGMTNVNYKVTDHDPDQDQAYVVRLGSDSPDHLILRSNEVATGIAGFQIGTSPEVVYFESGALVIRYINGQVLDEQAVRQTHNLKRIVSLLKVFHEKMPNQLSGYPILFWVFQVIRHYKNTLEKYDSEYVSQLPELIDIAMKLESAVGSYRLVFGHNDLLAGNLIDDGQRLWLIDFDYAGFNSPLFDLSNLASNNGLCFEDERRLLEDYFEKTPDEALWLRYTAMKCASLLRETMWSMVSQSSSNIDFDYRGYTQENRERFQQTYKQFQLDFS